MGQFHHNPMYDRGIIIKPSIFATRLQSSFHSHPVSASTGEVRLFRHLIDAFKSITTEVYVDEYHGTKHQVTYPTKRPWRVSKGKPARCEICDVLMITYVPATLDVRVSFIQAKLEKSGSTSGSTPTFEINVEQHDLLSTRPDVTGVTPFHPPSDVLSSARLASVGTFLFFYATGSHYEGYFSIASNIVSPTGVLSNRARTSLVKYGKQAHISLGYAEQIVADTIYKFGECVSRGIVGTPIGPTMSPSLLRQWVTHLVQSSHNSDSNVAVRDELLGILGGNSTSPQEQLDFDVDERRPIRNLVIVRSEGFDA